MGRPLDLSRQETMTTRWQCFCLCGKGQTDSGHMLEVGLRGCADGWMWGVRENEV